jgi:hypothetical protein
VKPDRFNFSIRPCEKWQTGLSEVLMAYGFDRFLTTHTGSLPRPDDLIRAMFAKEEGVPVDRAALAARISGAVAEVVNKQITSGVDLVNDGEMSKPRYATYIKDRLTGFAGCRQPADRGGAAGFGDAGAGKVAGRGRSVTGVPGVRPPLLAARPCPSDAAAACCLATGDGPTQLTESESAWLRCSTGSQRHRCEWERALRRRRNSDRRLPYALWAVHLQHSCPAPFSSGSKTGQISRQLHHARYSIACAS